ncbi:MAG: tRNA (adenosine(37)-N6)-threonylcarbamoyltransferase complex ATPase subunit type 1 TsaE [Patescibacteria group bacterium]|nr:tRNA (adenosine(37)-N6)-threonylcarbamoyltransferase complex ATPase subunit type 1 TsaE [Patescibacteria group bacterium]
MIKKAEYISNSPEETFTIGKELAATLKGGEVLALSGDLGAGKTAFVQGLAAGLGVKALVNSPTYTIMKLYRAKKGVIKQLCHIDAYRLDSGSELKDIGVDEYFGQADTVSAVEWAGRVKSSMPSNSLIISIKILDKNSRGISF